MCTNVIHGAMNRFQLQFGLLACLRSRCASSVSMTTMPLNHISMHVATSGRQTPHQACRSRHGKQLATGRLAPLRAQAMPEKAVGAATTDAIRDDKVRLRVEDDKQAKIRSKSQQSSNASHVKPCYPPRTINCSDGIWAFPINDSRASHSS